MECTRKHNLEIAVAYPLVTLAGGIFVTMDGKSAGDKYLQFGQKDKTPVVASTSENLAKELIDYVKT